MEVPFRAVFAASASVFSDFNKMLRTEYVQKAEQCRVLEKDEVSWCLGSMYNPY
jgi:hypothetical protein